MDLQKYIIPSSDEAVISKYLHAKAGKNGVSISSTFEITSRCNFNCKMCYVHNTDCNKNEPFELTADQWIRIAEEAKNAGTMFVLITGGEPLIRKDFCKIYEKISEMGFVISLNTNLSLLNEQHIESFKKYPPNRINVSLYGTSNETYIDLCGVPAYEKVINNISKLKQINIPVKINTSITPRNISDRKKIEDFCLENQLINKQAYYMFPAVRLNCNNERLNPEEIAEYRVKSDFEKMSAKDFSERADRVSKGIEHIEQFDCIDSETDGEGIKCRAGSSCSWIDWRGNMSFCGMIPTDNDCNVLSFGFNDCWERTKNKAKSIQLPSECAVCKYKYICNVCAAGCFCETGSFNTVPKFICEIAKLTAAKYEEYKQCLPKEDLK